MKTVIRLLSLTLAFIAGTNHLSGQARKQAMVSGKVFSTSNEIMDFATVQVKGTSIGTRPNEKGIYHLKVDAGKHTLVFKAMGYATVERTVTLQAGERQKLNVKMHQKDMELAEVKVEASHVGRINKSAFNAVAVDLKGMAGLNKNLAEVLTTVPGVKLRETGGMGSDIPFKSTATALNADLLMRPTWLASTFTSASSISFWCILTFNFWRSPAWRVTVRSTVAYPIALNTNVCFPASTFR